MENTHCSKKETINVKDTPQQNHPQLKIDSMGFAHRVFEQGGVDMGFGRQGFAHGVSVPLDMGFCTMGFEYRVLATGFLDTGF